MKYLVCFILIIPLVLSGNVTRLDLPSKGTFELPTDPDYHDVNLTILSKINKPFSTIIYTPEGKKYVYKGVKMNYVGHISYIEMENIFNENNKIKIIQEHIDNPKPIVSLYDMIISSISIITFLLTILTDKSHLTKSLLILLILIQFYNSSDNLIEIGNKIRKIIIRF